MTKSTIPKPVVKSPPLLRFNALAAVVPIASVFLMEAVFFKGYQVFEIVGQFSFGAFLLSILPDLAFSLIIAVLFSLLLSRFGGKKRWFTAALFYVLMAGALVLNAASHGYFLATGANLSLSPIEYLFTNLASTSSVVASEASFFRSALPASQLLLLVLCILLPRFAFIKKLGTKVGDISKKNALRLLGASLLLIAVASVLPKPEGPTASIARNIPWSITVELLTDRLLGNTSVDIAEAERFGTDLQLTQAPNAPRPNIVFIIFESLGWKHSDVYFPGKGTTPFLAEIAQKGLVVDQLYTTVPHTTKAIMSLLCGIYPYFETAPREAQPGILPKRCLAHILKHVGYETAFFQPALNFEGRAELSANMGYDTYRGLKDMPREGFESMSYFGAEDNMMIEPSMDWVSSVKDKPFFLTYMTLATHHNYAVPQSFPYVDFDVEDDDLKNYLNAVRYIDTFIESVFTKFTEAGLMDNTVFIIAGDHGEGFFEHKRRQHDLVIWEEGIRVAGLIYAPKLLPKPHRITGVRSHLDWVPTVSDLLGITPVNDSFLGSSMLKPAPKRTLYHSCWFRNQCMASRTGDTKSIYFYDLSPMEVYDNRTDPFDEHNLAYTGPYDQRFLDQKKSEILRFKRVVDRQYDEFEENLAKGKITDRAPPVSNQFSAAFGHSVELIGFDISPNKVETGRDLRVRYVFKCNKKPDPGDELFVHILHDGGFINADHVPVGGAYPVGKWQPGEYIVDEHTIHVPKEWTGDEIQLAVGFWNRDTHKRLTVRKADGKVTENRVVLAKIPLVTGQVDDKFSMDKLREKLKDLVLDTPPPVEKPIDVTFGDRVTLVGVDLRRTDVELAGTVEMTYIFKALKSVPESWRLKVRLESDTGGAIKGDHVPINGLYPFAYWQEGEYITDKHMIHIDMYRSKVGNYKAYLFIEAGGRPVPITSGEGDHVEEDRVYLGDVVIRKDHDPHLRR